MDLMKGSMAGEHRLRRLRVGVRVEAVDKAFDGDEMFWRMDGRRRGGSDGASSEQ